MTHKINSFSEIDFLTVDASLDTFILPNGETYFFSDRMCDVCWTGGTVLESKDKKKKFYCVLCNQYLKKCTFVNDFLHPTGDTMEFYLPEKWSTDMVEEWYESFKKRRIEQEKIREKILKEGKE